MVVKLQAEDGYDIFYVWYMREMKGDATFPSADAISPIFGEFRNLVDMTSMTHRYRTSNCGYFDK